MANKIQQMWDDIQKAVEPWLKNRAIKDVSSWDGAASNYDSTDAYCSACLIDVNPAGETKTQALCKLPVRGPGDGAGTYVRQAIHAAAQRFDALTKPDGVTDTAWAAAKKKAANELISAYDEAGEQAPDAVYTAAGKTPPKAQERALSAQLMLDQIYAALEMYQPMDEWATTGWVRIVDLYIDDGSTYIIVAREGKLYRIDVTINGDQVTLGEMVNVTPAFSPVGQSRLDIIRQADGTVRWIAKAATSVLNRSGEIDSVQLFDAFIEHVKATGEYPVMDFFHLYQKSRMGGADFMARADKVLIIGGTFDDTDVGRAAAKGLEEQGDYWGISISFLPTAAPVMEEVAEGVRVPVYTAGICRFVSILPEPLAASLFTAVGVQEVNRVEKLIKEQMVKLYGQALADKMEQEIDATNRTIAEQGLISRQVPAPMAPDKPTDAPAADPAKPAPAPAAAVPDPSKPGSDKPRTIELDEKALKAIADLVGKDLDAKIQTAMAGLKPAMETAGKAIEQMKPALEKLQTDLIAEQERVKKLEATDDEKKKLWQADLPAQDRVVVTRPTARHNLASEEPGSVDAAATAEQTLAAMKSRTPPAK